jgi:RNA polymerase sigma-70 factor (ECF subfamily)
MRTEAGIRLQQAIDELPDHQREAVRLRHLQGWSLAQIAALLDRSEVAVAGLLKRGLRRLRDGLRECSEFADGDNG